MGVQSITETELNRIALPASLRLRICRRFALACAEQALEACAQHGFAAPRGAWLCVCRLERYLESPSELRLRQLHRARERADKVARSCAAAVRDAFRVGAASGYAAANGTSLFTSEAASAAARAAEFADKAAGGAARAAEAAAEVAHAAAYAATYLDSMDAAVTARSAAWVAQRQTLIRVTLEVIGEGSHQDWRPAFAIAEDDSAWRS